MSARFFYWLAWACYAMATRFISVTLLGMDEDRIARIQFLIMGCFFLLVAIHERQRPS